MSALRFSGASTESLLSLVNQTTGDQLIPDAAIESITANLPFDLVKKMFIGEIGPQYREFYDGYEISFKFEHTDATQSATMISNMVAKSQGVINDEFAISATYPSPDNGILHFTFRDVHFEGIPLDLAGQHDFLTSEIKGKGNKFKVEVL